MASALRRGVSSLLLVTFATASVPLVALAQTDEERAGARAAADAGLKAYDAKKWSDCVDFFTRAESLVHAPPHLLYMARCSVQIGRLVKAREAYLKMKNEVIGPEKPKAFHDAKTSAEKELAALEPRIPYVSVKVNNAAGKTVTVTMDGVTIPPALVGIPRPVDPGEHKFLATAEGMTSKVESVTAKEGQTDSVTLELAPGSAPAVVVPTVPTAKPETTAAPSATTSAAPTSSATTAPTTAPTETPPETGGGSGLKTAGFVTIGVGVVGLALGGVFLAQSSSKKKDADAAFDGGNCGDATAILPGGSCGADVQANVNDLDSKSKSAKTIGFLAGGVGIVAIGAGIAMIVMGGQKTETPATAKKGFQVVPVIGFGSLGLNGTF